MTRPKEITSIDEATNMTAAWHAVRNMGLESLVERPAFGAQRRYATAADLLYALWDASCYGDEETDAEIERSIVAEYNYWVEQAQGVTE